jgi:large subunit ribosomal protein L15
MAVFEITQHPSNVAEPRRRGRGIGAGRGKTSGRGQKGQGSRSGGTKGARFEGGQQPLVRHLPKLGGFKHHSKVTYHAVNLKHFEDAADGTVVDLMFLEEKSLLPKKLRGLRVKLLGDGKVSSKLTFRLNAYSHKARAAVEAAGGTCEVI